MDSIINIFSALLVLSVLFLSLGIFVTLYFSQREKIKALLEVNNDFKKTLEEIEKTQRFLKKRLINRGLLREEIEEADKEKRPTIH